MISQQQAAAIHARTVAALAPVGPHDLPVAAASVVWDPSDLPARVPVAVRLTVGDAVPQGLEPETLHRAAGGGLRRTIRQMYQVPLAVTIHARPSTTSPRFEHRASYMARRVLRHYATSECGSIFDSVGVGILATSGPRDLSRLLRGSQWMTVARLELLLAVCDLGIDQVGWIATASGSGTVTVPADAVLPVIPWSTET